LRTTVKEHSMQLRNMKIGIRAASVFALLGALVLVMGLIALYETRQMDKATDEIRVTWMPAVVALGDISTNLGRARAITLRAALDDSPTERMRNIELFKGINEQLNNGLRTMKPPSSPPMTVPCSTH
jgi:methyl-accepting chemotaxis protein